MSKSSLYWRLEPTKCWSGVSRSQVSAGTELNSLRGVARSGHAAAYPGYAAVGRVLDVGGGITDFAPGARVLTMGRHATHCTVDVTGSPLQNGYIRKLERHTDRRTGDVCD